MDRTEFGAHRIAQRALCDKIMDVKQEDYAAPTDVLYNFKTVGDLMGMEPRQVAGVYMSKHLISILHWAGTGEQESEDFAERIADAHNYLDFMYALYLEDTL